VALGLLTATAGTGSAFLEVQFPFSSLEFGAINELVCELVSTQLMAQGLLTATASTGNGIFIVNFFSST
jgi:hypothetical protein